MTIINVRKYLYNLLGCASPSALASISRPQDFTPGLQLDARTIPNYCQACTILARNLTPAANCSTDRLVIYFGIDDGLAIVLVGFTARRRLYAITSAF